MDQGGPLMEKVTEPSGVMDQIARFFLANDSMTVNTYPFLIAAALLLIVFSPMIPALINFYLEFYSSWAGKMSNYAYSRNDYEDTWGSDYPDYDEMKAALREYRENKEYSDEFRPSSDSLLKKRRMQHQGALAAGSTSHRVDLSIQDMAMLN